MPTIHVSPSATQRLATARSFALSGPVHAPLLLLGATRDAVDDFVRTLTASAPATFGWQRFTPTALAAHLVAPVLAASGRTPASPRGLEAVAARTAYRCMEQNQIHYFAPVARAPGFARALCATVTELRAHRVSPSTLKALGPGGQDLAMLLKAFEEELLACQLADRADVLGLAVQQLKTGHHPWRGIPLLLLDVPVHTPCERDFLRALWEQASTTLITVPTGDAETLHHLGHAPLEHGAPAAPAESGLARVREYLFSRETPPFAEATSDVSLFSAPGEGRECVEIARRILKLAQSGVRFDDVAILLRDPGRYLGLLETALGRAGIPAWFSRGTQRPDPSGRAFLAILSCAAENLSAHRFAEYLSLGQVPDVDDHGAPPVGRDVWVAPNDESFPAVSNAAPRAEPVRKSRKSDTRQLTLFSLDAPPRAPAPPIEIPVVDGTLRAPYKWEELLVEASVIGGKDRWVKRLAGLEQEWLARVVELERTEPESPKISSIKKDLTNLAHLRRFALPLIEHLAAWPVLAHWGEWLDHLRKLAPMLLKRPERVLAILAEMQPMATLGPVSRSEVRDVLMDALSTLQDDPPARRFGRVWVATPEQVRGRSFSHVFVPGMAERVFPRKLHEDPLLLDEARSQLAALEEAVQLRSQTTRSSQERLLLRLCVGAAEKQLLFSYARVQMPEARAQVPSFYALDLMRALTGRIPDHGTLEREAERAADARLAWPAPASPNDAIDDLEHDLSTLRPLLQSAGEEARGGAAYLLKLNEHLARSLRSRYARWDHRWGVYDGLVRNSPSVAAALDARRLTSKAYSVSALQKFAVCPYQFLLSAVHRLEPRKEAAPLEEMDPLTKGALFHEVQAAFLRTLDDRKMLPVTSETLPSSQTILDETLTRHAREWQEKLAPAIDRVWDSGIAAMRTDLRTWLHHVSLDVEWIPKYFELGIGFPPEKGRDPRSVREPALLDGGYLLHGFLDLVEENATDQTLRVTDHKTGRNHTDDGMVTGHGEHLQPILYGMAAERALGKTVKESRLFFCTSAGAYEERRVSMTPELHREFGREVLRVIDGAVGRGSLVPMPRDKACERCDFIDVCGPQEAIRIGRKQKGTAPLEIHSLITDLDLLRGNP